MIEIVTHVYAEELPQYAIFLRVQLSSLVEHAPKVANRINVCYFGGDELVREVLDDFRDLLGSRLMPYPMDKPNLFRRAIGRNTFALLTRADIVWHTDVDHYWGEGCLDSLYRMWSNTVPDKWRSLSYPREVMVPVNHEHSDAFWQSCLSSRGLARVDAAGLEFVAKKYNRAIGGVQIVDGAFSRLHGYLHGTKWVMPTTTERPFACFRDDVKYRRFCETIGSAGGIDLHGVYRLRHTAVTYK